MRSNIAAAGVLLQAGLSIAKPYLYEKDGMVYNVLHREGVLERNEAAMEARGMSLEQSDVADSCMGSYELIATGTGTRPTGSPDPNFDFFDFCSSFIRPTKTYTVTIRTSTPTPPVVTITVTATKTSTSTRATTTSSAPPPPPPTTKSTSTPDVVTVTVTTTRTSTSTSKSTTPPSPTLTRSTTTSKAPTPTTTSTSTRSSSLTSQTSTPPTSTTTAPTSSTPTSSLCPTPVANQVCGVAGWGYAENNLYSGSSIDAATCHQLCLANPDCKSFQTQDSSYDAPQCNLYRVDASGNNTIPGAAPYVFYDRGCPDYSPATCTKSTPPATTARPTLAVGAGLVERQRGRPSTVSLPWFLEPFGPATISEVCTCIITLAPPAIGYTTTIRW